MGKLGAFIGGLVGAMSGIFIGFYQVMQAKAAVKVRPNLADVGFVDAFLTGHGTDWLFYHEPALGFLVSCLILSAICAVYGGVQ